MAARRPPDPTGDYARAVVAGEIVAGDLVVRACERHLRDLEHGHERGLQFDLERALRAITFFGALRHTKGRWARDYFVLTPPQEFIVGSIFGWLRADGTRRFRTAYIEVARKFGKSELAGGLALYVSFFDEPRELGAEGYCAATKRDQAKIVHEVAKRMVRRAPAFNGRLRVLARRIVDHETGSYLDVLGADADTLDGLSPHVVVIDELHAHPSSAVVDVMESATGAREQPLQIEITTAGHDADGVCYEHHEYSERVLDPNADSPDDAWFAFVACARPTDAIDDEIAWRRANPNYGITVQRDWYETRARRAKASPSALAEFKLKNLCLWGADAVRAIDLTVWDRGARNSAGPRLVNREELAKRPCFGAFDLATVDDLTSFGLVWPPAKGEREWYVWVQHYAPEEAIERAARESKVPYARWVAEGRIAATPGNVTDYDFIEADILGACERFDVREVAHDRAFGTQLVTHLQARKVPLVQFGQGFISMAQPVNDFERLVIGGHLVHGGCPVLRWMAGNVVWAMDPAGNRKPHKRRSKGKIDGIVVSIMAIGRAMLHVPKSSPYSKRGVRSVG